MPKCQVGGWKLNAAGDAVCVKPVRPRPAPRPKPPGNKAAKPKCQVGGWKLNAAGDPVCVKPVRPRPFPRPKPKAGSRKLRYNASVVAKIIPDVFRKLGPVFPEEYGGQARFSLGLPSGVQPFLGFSYLYNPQLRYYPGIELKQRYQIDLGLLDTTKIKLFSYKKFVTRVQSSNSFSGDIQTHRHDKTGGTFGVESTLGAQFSLGDYFSLGGGIFQRTEFGGSGPNRFAYQMGFYGAINVHFYKFAPIVYSRGALISIRASRLVAHLFHAYRNADLGSPRIVGDIPGQVQENKDLLLGTTNALNYGTIAKDTAQLGMNGSRKFSGIFAGSSIGLGLLTEILGAYFGKGGIAGIGAAVTCGGVGALPSAFKQKKPNIWYNKGAMLGCAAVQAVVGIALLLTAPNPTTGTDSNGIPWTDPDADPAQNPFNGISAFKKGQRFVGIQLLASFLGTAGASLMLMRDPRPGRSGAVKGAVANLRFRY